MDLKSVYKPLSSDVFVSGKLERKILSNDFLTHFLESKVSGNKKKEVADNLNSYAQFSASEKKVLKRKLHSTKSKRLSAKERRALKVYDVPKLQKFSNFYALHLLWEQYMTKLLELESKSKSDEKLWTKQLQSADYHGALLTIIEARNSTLIGKTGIVIQETRNTLKMATPRDIILVVPKVDCLFAFELADFVFTIHGNYLTQRSAARSGKKFKSKGANPMMIVDF